MNVDEMLNIQKKIVPETVDLFMKRYEILKIISTSEPIGRRALATKSGLTECSMRTEIGRLKDIGLISVETSGVTLSDDGRNAIDDVEKAFYYIKNVSDLEIRLKNKLNLKRVAVVAGDVDKNDFTFSDLGKRAAEIVVELIKNDMIIGITGGTTMACVVNQMKKKRGMKNLLVLPARGALNEELEIQANTIAANLAEKLNSEYKLLHIPDNLDDEELSVLKNNKIISEVLDDIKKTDLLIFGLGNAKDMAERRNANSDVFEKIQDENWTAEAFGYYFDHNGHVKMQTNSVGISLEDFKNIKNAVGVAAGSRKAEAIYAISKFNSNFVLVTDEGAARKILTL